MVDLKKVLTDIARAIVEHPDSVAVEEVPSENPNEVLLSLSVADEDMGMIIGKRGKIARAVRTVMKTVAKTDGRKVSVDIKDKE